MMDSKSTKQRSEPPDLYDTHASTLWSKNGLFSHTYDHRISLSLMPKHAYVSMSLHLGHGMPPSRPGSVLHTARRNL